MARKRKSRNSKSADRIQCHFISNTHWDREWRYSAQRTRHMLVHLLDMLFDIFAKEPKFKSFHMDSQTLPIQDYLEARPDREKLVRKYVSEKKLLIGPWFCLPDEFCVAGESLIRNLLLGHRIAAKYGHVSKTGYSPFSWGQISQMPQIYRGFGIDVASFYRGINTLVSPKSEFYWEGPDGSRVIGSRLARRPRYNVWYVIQRPVYWGMEDENCRNMSWRRGHAPFRMVDPKHADIDYQYAHPEFGYKAENVPARAEQAIREQDAEWTTPHRFWSAGHDSSCPDIRETRMIADCAKALKEKADVFHSTVAAWQNGLRANQRRDWPVLHGEMRHSFTKGSSSVLYGWIISSRTYIKQDNFRTERSLMNYAEPLAVFASLLGAAHPQPFLDLAYNYLLQNHGHDSIGGCSRDIVHDDMLFRTRQCREICVCVSEQAMIDICGSIDLGKWSTEDMALVVFNPAPFKRTEIMQAFIDAPQEWNCAEIELTDETGARIPCQFGESGPYMSGIVQSPNDVANTMPAVRHNVRAQFAGVPGSGYRTFFVRPVRDRKFTQPATQLTGPQKIENEFLSVEICPNGTLDVLDKRTGHLFEGLGWFRDCGEVGNPWEHHGPVNDRVFTTLNERAEVTLVRDGALETSFRVAFHWALPESRTPGDGGRSSVLKPYHIVNTVTLRKGEPWVEIQTELDNTVEDHYLQVVFPARIHTDKIAVQGQFDVVERSIRTPDYSLYDEPPQTEQPMNSFVDLSDGKTGLALLNEGLKAYDMRDDADRNLCLTLLRCYPLRICVTTEMIDYSHIEKGSQCPGRHSFRYAIMPHADDWAEGGVWKASERFNLGFLAAQIGPSTLGTEPLSKAFVELEPDNLHLSAIKRSEDGKGWVLRLFNPFDGAVEGRVRLNGGFAGPGRAKSPVERAQSNFALPKGKGKRWARVRRVTLEEKPEQALRMDKEGWVPFAIGTKQILTFEFLA